MEQGTATDKRDLWLAGMVVVLALIVYWLTLAPGLTGEDSGELAAAAHLGGVAHPPGFPLWCIIGWLFSHLPFLTPIFGTNLMSAVFGALTAGGVCLTARVCGASRPASAAGGLALAFSQQFWGQAVITEVYTLNTFLFICIFYCVIRWRQQSEAWRWLYAAAVVFGLSLANHYMLSLLVAPGYLFLVWPRRRELWQNRRQIFICAALVLPGLLVYAYLPLMAARAPYVNWGNPVEWDGFVSHVSRQSYKSLEHGREVGRGVKLLFLGQFAVQLWQQFTPFLLVFVVWGARSLWRRRRDIVLSSAAIALLNTVLLIVLLSFTFEAENRQRVDNYYLPAYCVLGVFLAIGLDGLLRRLREWAAQRRSIAGKPGMRPALAGLVLLLPVLPLIVHWQTNDYSESRICGAYAEALLEQVERDAIVFPSSDSITFALVYRLGVEYPDREVLLGDKYGELSPELLELYGLLPDRASKANARQIHAAIIRSSGRPVYYTDRHQIPRLAGYRGIPHGLAYRMVPIDSNAGLEKPEAPPMLPGLEQASASADTMERGLAVANFRMLAEHELSHGDNKKGYGYLQRAREVATQKEELNNLGSIFARYGFVDDARASWQAASRIYPDYLTPHLNLAQQALAMRKPAIARRHLAAAMAIDPEHHGVQRLRQQLGGPGELSEFQEAVEQMPGNPAAYNNLACKLAERGEFKQAIAMWERALEHDPTYAMAHKNLAAVYQNELNDPVKASFHRTEFERLSEAAPGSHGAPQSGSPGSSHSSHE